MLAETWPAFTANGIGLVQCRTVLLEDVALLRELVVPFAVLATTTLIANTVLLGGVDVINVAAGFTFKDGGHGSTLQS
ncbi:hypothetical protein D3C79_816810 [compost metagenome]